MIRNLFNGIRTTASHYFLGRDAGPGPAPSAPSATPQRVNTLTPAAASVGQGPASVKSAAPSPVKSPEPKTPKVSHDPPGKVSCPLCLKKFQWMQGIITGKDYRQFMCKNDDHYQFSFYANEADLWAGDVVGWVIGDNDRGLVDAAVKGRARKAAAKVETTVKADVEVKATSPSPPSPEPVKTSDPDAVFRAARKQADRFAEIQAEGQAEHERRRKLAALMDY